MFLFFIFIFVTKPEMISPNRPQSASLLALPLAAAGRFGAAALVCEPDASLEPSAALLAAFCILCCIAFSISCTISESSGSPNIAATCLQPLDEQTWAAVKKDSIRRGMKRVRKASAVRDWERGGGYRMISILSTSSRARPPQRYSLITAPLALTLPVIFCR